MSLGLQLRSVGAGVLAEDCPPTRLPYPLEVEEPQHNKNVASGMGEKLRSLRPNKQPNYRNIPVHLHCVGLVKAREARTHDERKLFPRLRENWLVSDQLNHPSWIDARPIDLYKQGYARSTPFMIHFAGRSSCESRVSRPFPAISQRTTSNTHHKSAQF